MIALTSTSIAWLLFAVILGGWAVYAFLNLRQSHDELGSEVEMAANRKKYYDDEELEGPRLTRVLGIGVILLVIIVVGLPLYWILEPSRLAGATEAKEEQFIEWGSRLFAPTADGGFNCAGCHGGMNGGGGAAPYNLTDPATGEVTAVELGRSGAQHHLLQVQRRRGGVHPGLRSTVLADVTVGRRGWRPHERPADRDADRVSPQHPDRT